MKVSIRSTSRVLACPENHRCRRRVYHHTPPSSPAADGGQRLFKSEGEFEQPEFRWTASADWRGENYTAALAVNYISEFDDDAEAGFGDQTVDAMTTVDVTVSYIGFDKLTLTVGATNLFNEEPPFSYADFMGFAPTVHSGQGRFSYVQASYQF